MFRYRCFLLLIDLKPIRDLNIKRTLALFWLEDYLNPAPSGDITLKNLLFLFPLLRQAKSSIKVTWIRGKQDWYHWFWRFPLMLCLPFALFMWLGLPTLLTQDWWYASWPLVTLVSRLNISKVKKSSVITKLLWLVTFLANISFFRVLSCRSCRMLLIFWSVDSSCLFLQYCSDGLRNSYRFGSA